MVKQVKRIIGVVSGNTDVTAEDSLVCFPISLIETGLGADKSAIDGNAANELERSRPVAGRNVIPFVRIRHRFVDYFGNDKIENRVAKKFKASITRTG